MRVAVVGAGIFGCTAAIELARNGHTVDLYERHPDILLGATRANQGRLHHGYHYPRDPGAKALAEHARRFAQRFPYAAYVGGEHYYAIAEGSKTTPEAYREFCEAADLPYRRTWSPLLRRSGIADCIAVGEALIDVPALRGQLRRELREAKVRVHCAVDAAPDRVRADLTVVATYGRPYGRASAPLRFEVCETALVRLGPHYAGVSIVVMDGPFLSVDPVLGTGMHMLYDVAHSVHHANVGTVLEVPDRLVPLLDRGLVRTRWSRVETMVEKAGLYLRGIDTPEYVGSLFTVRAVLPDVDATDERPTLVEADGDVVTVLSGKICTAPWAAEQVVALAREAVSA